MSLEPAGAKGLDVSSWQHPAGAPIDWETVRAHGATFVIVKATQGTTYVNPWYERDMEDAFAAGLLTGAYHFYEAGSDPAAQAAHFVRNIAGDALDLGAWLDFEVAPGPEWTLSGWVNGFIEACKPDRPSVGLYCTLSMWEGLKGVNVAPAKLWLADWESEVAPAGATVWQYGQGHWEGVPATVDVDALTSTRGINLPSAPSPRPSVQTVHPVEVPEEPAEPAPFLEASE